MTEIMDTPAMSRAIGWIGKGLRMRAFRCGVVLLVSTFVLGCYAKYAEANEDTLLFIDIQAHIDGRDQLIVNRDTLQWEHFDFAAVGRHAGANSPTIVSTTSVRRNTAQSTFGTEWIPDWPLLPPDEIRFEASSSVFEGLQPPLGEGDDVEWSVIKRFGRGDVTIVEQPTRDNDFTLVVEFDDNLPGGSNFYIVRLVRGTIGP